MGHKADVNVRPWELHLVYCAAENDPVIVDKLQNVITEDRLFPHFDIKSTPLATLKFHYLLHIQEGSSNEEQGTRDMKLTPGHCGSNSSPSLD